MTPTNIITQISYSYFYTLYSGNTNGNMYISVCAKTYVLYSCVCKNLCLVFLFVQKLMSYIGMDFDNPKVYGGMPPSAMVLFFLLPVFKL